VSWTGQRTAVGEVTLVVDDDEQAATVRALAAIAPPAM
jgi:hypothetical protein